MSLMLPAVSLLAALYEEMLRDGYRPHPCRRGHGPFLFRAPDLMDLVKQCVENKYGPSAKKGER